MGEVLAVFSVGLLPYMLFQLLLRIFYAMHDSRTAAMIGVAVMVVNVAAAFAAAVLLPPGHITAGLAENRHIAVGRRRGETRRSGQQLRDRRGAACRDQRVHDDAPRGRVFLAVCGEQQSDLAVQVAVRPWARPHAVSVAGAQGCRLK